MDFLDSFKSYFGYYWTPKWSKISQNSIISSFFWPEGQKKSSTEGKSPPQELEVGPRSGPYLLVWVMKQKVVITLSVYTVEASNKDQAMLMDIRKKDMIDNLKVIMTFVIIEPLDWPTAFYGVCSQQFAK